MDPNELVATIIWQAMVMRRQAEEIERLQRELAARQQQPAQPPAPAAEEEERVE